MRESLTLITGATSGIGLEAAKQLARMQVPLVLHGRTTERAQAACQAVLDLVPRAKVAPIAADLADLSQVKAMAQEMRQRYSHLAVLVNNAGVLVDQRQLTADGHELTWAVNHLAGFALTMELMPMLLTGVPARVIMVSSQLHRQGKLNLDDLNQSHGKFNGVKAYADSKLMNVLFAYELSRRLVHAPITSNCLHPGFVATQFDRHLHGPMAILWKVGLAFAIPPSQGAGTTVHLAHSPHVVNQTGKYYERKRSRRSSPASYNANLSRQLWERSEQLTGLSLANV